MSLRVGRPNKRTNIKTLFLKKPSSYLQSQLPSLFTFILLLPFVLPFYSRYLLRVVREPFYVI